VIDVIARDSRTIQAAFDSWTTVERRIFKTHYNELIDGATYLGNILVADTSTFRDRMEEMPAMMNSSSMFVTSSDTGKILWF
jgi:hypothetical protein